MATLRALYVLFDGEIEIGVGVGLILQREMPPFGFKRLEAVAQHRLPQDQTIGLLLSGDRLVIGMGEFAEPVERATHIHFLPRLHVEERQIDRGAAGVAGACHDILPFEQFRLGHFGIEIGFHPGVIDILRPAHEVIHSALGAVGIVDLKSIALRHNVVAHRFEGFGGLAGEDGFRLLITGDAFAHEVVSGVVANFLDNVRDEIGYDDEIIRHGFRGLRFGIVGGAGQDDEEGGAYGGAHGGKILPSFQLFHYSNLLLGFRAQK